MNVRQSTCRKIGFLFLFVNILGFWKTAANEEEIFINPLRPRPMIIDPTPEESSTFNLHKYRHPFKAQSTNGGSADL
jgi:hypothetical protein